MANVAQTLEKNIDFYNFFIVSLDNASLRFAALKGTEFRCKKSFGSKENRKRKKRLVARRLGNSYFPKNEATGRGVGGRDKSLPGGMASRTRRLRGTRRLSSKKLSSKKLSSKNSKELSSKKDA